MMGDVEIRTSFSLLFGMIYGICKMFGGRSGRKRRLTRSITLCFDQTSPPFPFNCCMLGLSEFALLQVRL
jgi:hypothetical protein